MHLRIALSHLIMAAAAVPLAVAAIDLAVFLRFGTSGILGREYSQILEGTPTYTAMLIVLPAMLGFPFARWLRTADYIDQWNWRAIVGRIFKLIGVVYLAGWIALIAWGYSISFQRSDMIPVFVFYIGFPLTIFVILKVAIWIVAAAERK